MRPLTTSLPEVLLPIVHDAHISLGCPLDDAQTEANNFHHGPGSVNSKFVPQEYIAIQMDTCLVRMLSDNRIPASKSGNLSMSDAHACALQRKHTLGRQLDIMEEVLAHSHSLKKPQLSQFAYIVRSGIPCIVVAEIQHNS